jgi:hypothetical protein
MHLFHSDVYYVRAAMEKYTGYVFPLDTVEDAMRTHAENYPREPVSEVDVRAKLGSLKLAGAILQFDEGYVPRRYINTRVRG